LTLFEHMFDTAPLMSTAVSTAAAAVPGVLRASELGGSPLPGGLPGGLPTPHAPALPLPPPLAGLLPDGVIRRGSTLRVSRSTSLLLAVLAEASRAGAWCGAVGLPTLGVAAAAEAGVDLDRLALVPAPGPEWPTVVAALLDALDVVVVASGATGAAPASAQTARRLSARARERRGVLLVVGAWEGADADLSVARQEWDGIGLGHGRLRSRSLDVRASGRRIGGRPRSAHVRLSPAGQVTDDSVA
jgi:hypothetical protein